MRRKFCPREVCGLIDTFATIDRVDDPLRLDVFPARDKVGREFASITDLMGYTSVRLGVWRGSGCGICGEA
jgi:hypothetical protein